MARHGQKSGTLAAADARFDDLYRRHYRTLHAYCRRRVSGPRVEDAVAEVFTVVWRRIADVPPPGEELLWLYGVARRIVAHEWRAAGRRSRLTRRASSRPDVAPASEPELQVVRRTEYDLIVRAARRLPPTEREILFLTVWEELPQAEIAELLDISVGAVKQRLLRARRRLAREYERLDPDEGGGR